MNFNRKLYALKKTLYTLMLRFSETLFKKVSKIQAHFNFFDESRFKWGYGGSVDIALTSKSRLLTQQSRDRIRPHCHLNRARKKDCVSKTNLGLGGVPTGVKKNNQDLS
jgi:hypothetical protein